MSTTTIEIQEEAIQPSLFESPIFRLTEITEQLREDKKMKKEMEENYPMDLEDLLVAFEGMKKQVKDRKDQFIRELHNDEEYKKLLLSCERLKEEKANLVQEFKVQVSKAHAKNGEIDFVVVVNGAPHRLQTNESVNVYLNGKELK